MAKNGIITRKDIIEDEALTWGQDYAKLMQSAIDKNKEFNKGIIESSNLLKSIKASENNTTYIKIKEQEIQINKRQSEVWREQIQLESQLISAKNKNQLATESTSRSLIKERVELEATNRALKQTARE
jgi:hypothetical protein